MSCCSNKMHLGSFATLTVFFAFTTKDIFSLFLQRNFSLFSFMISYCWRLFVKQSIFLFINPLRFSQDTAQYTLLNWEQFISFYFFFLLIIFNLITTFFCSSFLFFSCPFFFSNQFLISSLYFVPFFIVSNRYRLFIIEPTFFGCLRKKYVITQTLS